MRLLRFVIFLLLCSIFVFGLVTFAGEWVDVDGKWKYKVGDDFVRNEIQWIGNKPKEAHNISELIIGCTSLQKIYINKDSLFYAIDDLKMLIEYK